MINLLFTVALASSCVEPKIENHTRKWTKFDQETLDHAKIRCGEIYPDAPCVKVFIKKNADTYNVICGGKI